MIESDLIAVFSFLQVFGNFPVFRWFSFKSIEEWLDTPNALEGRFQRCLHLLLDRTANKSFVDFCNKYSENGTFEAKKLHDYDPSLKLQILLGLLEKQLVVNKQLKKFLNHGSERLRVNPIGQDRNGNFYWCFLDRSLNIRVFQLKVGENNEEIWTLVAKDRDTFESLAARLDQQDCDSTVEAEPDTCEGPSGETSVDPDHETMRSSDEVTSVAAATEAITCQNCKKEIPSREEDSPEHSPLFHHYNSPKFCSSCKHKMLIDRLEEKLLIYVESLGKSEAVANKEPTEDIPWDDDGLIDSIFSMQPSPDLSMNPTSPDISCEPTSSNLPFGAVYANLSSPSEVEDNEVEDPSFEINMEEHLDDEDDDDIIINKDLPTNKKKENDKSRSATCKKDSFTKLLNSMSQIPRAKKQTPKLCSTIKVNRQVPKSATSVKVNRQVPKSVTSVKVNKVPQFITPIKFNRQAPQHSTPIKFNRQAPQYSMPTKLNRQAPQFSSPIKVPLPPEQWSSPIGHHNRTPIKIINPPSQVHRLRQKDNTEPKSGTNSWSRPSSAWRPQISTSWRSGSDICRRSSSAYANYKTLKPNNRSTPYPCQRTTGVSNNGRRMAIGNSRSFVGRIATGNSNSNRCYARGKRVASKMYFDYDEEVSNEMDGNHNDGYGYDDYESYDDGGDWYETGNYEDQTYEAGDDGEGGFSESWEEDGNWDGEDATFDEHYDEGDVGEYYEELEPEGPASMNDDDEFLGEEMAQENNDAFDCDEGDFPDETCQEDYPDETYYTGKSLKSGLNCTRPLNSSTLSIDCDEMDPSEDTSDNEYPCQPPEDDCFVVEVIE